MTKYQIHDLERLSGVKAHTIRIWEKRFSLVTPHRSESNRRFYDDSQLRKLLNVSTLLSAGYKISRIASMAEGEIESAIETETKGPIADPACQGYINDLIVAMLAFNEPAFDKVISAAIVRLGLLNAMTKVVYPFMYKTGILWSVNKTIPAQEHFASCIIRRKLCCSIDGLPTPNSDAKKFLLFLPENEWHEMGLLLADYIIRSKGHTSVYLGQSVPNENALVASETLKPDYLLMFYVTPRSAEEIAEQLKKLTSKGRNVLVVASSGVPLPQAENSKAKFLTNIDDLLTIL